MKSQVEKIRYNIYLKKAIKGSYDTLIQPGIINRKKLNKEQLKDVLANGTNIVEGHGVSTWVKPNNIYVEEVKTTYRRLTKKETDLLKQYTKEEYAELRKSGKVDVPKPEIGLREISDGENKIRKGLCKKCKFRDVCKLKRKKFKRTVCHHNNIQFRHYQNHKKYQEIKAREKINMDRIDKGVLVNKDVDSGVIGLPVMTKHLEKEKL